MSHLNVTPVGVGTLSCTPLRVQHLGQHPYAFIEFIE